MDDILNEKPYQVSPYVNERKMLNKLRLIFYVEEFEMKSSKLIEKIFSIYVYLDNKKTLKNSDTKVVMVCHGEYINRFKQNGVQEILKNFSLELKYLRVRLN